MQTFLVTVLIIIIITILTAEAKNMVLCNGDRFWCCHTNVLLLHKLYIFNRIIKQTLAGATALSAAFFGQGVGPIHADDFGCLGTESRLFDCPITTFGLCLGGHSQDAGVRCAEGILWH